MSAGNELISFSRALGPPVDAPIARTFSHGSRFFPWTVLFYFFFSFHLFPGFSNSEFRMHSRFSRLAFAAARIFLQISSAMSGMLWLRIPSGFWITSTAPYSKAVSVISSALSPRAETITTGVWILLHNPSKSLKTVKDRHNIV